MIRSTRTPLGGLGQGRSRVAAALIIAGLLVFMIGNVHPAQAAKTEPLTVSSETSGGSTISGMYVILEQSGSIIASGFTPITWYLDTGDSYQILAENYGQYSFSSWSSGDTSNPTTVTGPSGAASLTAIYSSSGSGGPSSITVEASYGGSSLSGMYVVLEQGGSVISSGFTPTTFSLVTGETYQILAENYGQYTFSQWSDGNTANPDTITASGSLTLTATYGGGGSSASPPAPVVGSGGLGIVIPLYAYPDSVWNTVVSYHQEYPSVPMLVVINPAGGPGSYDSTIASYVSMLQSAGITVLGYVSTLYTAAPLSQVDSEVSDYVSWYGIHGLFIDDMENVPGYESYYQSFASYAYSNGISFILGNPGTSVTSSYVGIFSNIGTYENSGAPSVSLIASYTMGYPASDWSFIAYNTAEPSQSYIDSMAQYVSYLYLTDQSNTWTTLPSYMSVLMAEIAAA